MISCISPPLYSTVSYIVSYRFIHINKHTYIYTIYLPIYLSIYLSICIYIYTQNDNLTLHLYVCQHVSELTGVCIQVLANCPAIRTREGSVYVSIQALTCLQRHDSPENLNPRQVLPAR